MATLSYSVHRFFFKIIMNLTDTYNSMFFMNNRIKNRKSIEEETAART